MDIKTQTSLPLFIWKRGKRKMMRSKMLKNEKNIYNL